LPHVLEVILKSCVLQPYLNPQLEPDPTPLHIYELILKQSMDQSQTKALAAIQPFAYQITTTKNSSPRFIAELVKGAISAPGAYIFTELLQLPEVQSLRGTEAEPWLKALEIFSWGTFEEYKGTGHADI
jgi:hypothetical protein